MFCERTDEVGVNRLCGSGTYIELFVLSLFVSMCVERVSTCA